MPQAAIQPVIWASLRHRRHLWTQNIEDETEMSAVWPVEVEGIKQVEDMFVPWMTTVTRLLEML